MRKVETIFLVGLLGLSGCIAKYSLPDSVPNARFEIDPGNIGRGNYFAWVFKNEGCDTNEYGTLINGAKKMDNGETTGITPIQANQPFVFTASYAKPHFGYAEVCWITGSFTPQVSHFYRAEFGGNEDTENCSVAVFDVTDAGEIPVDMVKSAKTCVRAF